MKKCYLYNKTVVITGASGGLGFAIAKLLINKYNCKIIGIARNEKKLLASIEDLGDKKANFSYKLFDVSVKENWQNFHDYLLSNNIQIDMVINNAGFMLPFAKFEKLSVLEEEEIIKTNLMSVIYSTHYLLPLIKNSSSPAILNVSSSAGLCAVVGQSMYCATKFALRGFTESLIQEYKKKIYVGGIYPGFIKTDIMNRQTSNTKNNKLILKLMKPVDKAAKIIVKGIKKKKKRIVLGIDGRSMSFFGKLFPSLTYSLVTKVLKSSKLDLFNEIFN